MAKRSPLHKYWDDGSKIRFYREGGSVTIAKEDIQIIEKAGRGCSGFRTIGN